ncbi:hypothetical protein [Halobacillus amylolyticus]|uniref:Uncharacterized protein n=1 Tax=Halobacillus amylolyticus TaxID=2932259 RepID=A0ABY4H6Y9_9BACI|nr:hypothetical protein [Halobacillus amylolyticus]UOR10641.1 hypothetical protein MUO15_13350 [Halobacillus amylolyticus]
MKKAAAVLFAIFLFMVNQSSFAFPVETNYSGKQGKEQNHSQVWVKDYDTEIQVIAPQTKNQKEITKQEEVVEIINTINSAYDVKTNPEQRIKLGVLKFNELDAIQVYLSKDKSSVYLHSDKGAKVITSKDFYQLFQPSIEAEPLPPGYEPKAFPPLPKGEGLDSEDVEKLN